MPPTSSQRFLDAVRRTLLSECRYAPGSRILVGCSGGPDSVALLLSLCALQGELDLELHVVYVDHGLRQEARREGAQVLELASSLDLPGEVVSVSVQKGPSLLGAARAARYGALGLLAVQRRASAVAVGHTRSDQSETLLMRLLGGAGLRGLCGMAPERPLGVPGDPGAVTRLIRPLLRLSRKEVAAFLAEAGVVAMQDPTNQDPRFLRTRLRQDVLPLLYRERPDLDHHLMELCQQLRIDAEYLDQLAGEALSRLLDPVGPEASEVVLSASALLALPPALSARVLTRILGPLSRRHIAQVLHLCHGPSAGTHAVDLSSGRRAERRYDALHLQKGPAPPQDPARQEEVAIPKAGEYGLGDTRIGIEVCPAGPAPQASRNEAHFAMPEVSLPLLLRRARPGDRIRVRGMAGHKKVSDLLVDDKVPRPRRGQVVLLCQGEEVLWVVGHRAAEKGRPPGGEAGGPGGMLIARLLSTMPEIPGRIGV